MLDRLPKRDSPQIAPWLELLAMFRRTKRMQPFASLAPSAVRGLILQQGKKGAPLKRRSGHEVHLDFLYPRDQPAMRQLYRKAKQAQWDSETTLPWETSVDPLNPDKPLVPDGFLSSEHVRRVGIQLTDDERARLSHSMVSWVLSQFLHGEQGALYAAAQVTEAVQFFDGKLYGATQVMDEARHVEVFERYLTTKLEKLYPINDNLFVIIDALMSDSRWDMKFLGMQVMVEGLALGAFGVLYRMTYEPLLKTLLRHVIQDEARHVHYGVLALREHMRHQLTEAERREREDWCFEIALLMKNRLMAYEVYEEWFEHRISRAQWRDLLQHSPGMEEFRRVMFSRLVPNLREIGLLTDRIRPRYAEAGLAQYFKGKAAPELTGDAMIAHLDNAGAA